MTNENNYTLLIQKLRDFKRKYYRNQILKGVIYFTTVFLFSYLLVAVLEYFGRFDSGVRGFLFYAFLAANAFIIGRFIILPALSLFELRKSLSYPRAAEIIGQHFSEVKDKLINTLQLKEQAGFALQDPLKRQLIEASIEQKIGELKPVPFVKAVDYRKNRKYLKYAVVPFVILLFILVRSPWELLHSTERIIKYNRYFEAEAPFKFVLKNDSLKAIRQQDFTVSMEIVGKELPAEAFLVVDGNPYKMNLKSKIDFNYILKSVQKDMTLQFSANGVISKPYELKVLPKPSLQKFDVALKYPAYLGKKDEILQNTGDLTIPAGTLVTWKFYTENTDEMEFVFQGHSGRATREGENLYTYQNKFTKDDSYILKSANKYLRNSDSIHYLVNVIPDAYPDIKVTQEQDSLHLKNLYFSGEISDDYGISRLAFKYHFTKKGDSSSTDKVEKSLSLPVAPGKLLQPFYYFWDMNGLDIKAGDEMEYYFEVWDNDGMGNKMTRSQKNFFKAPSLKEIEQNKEEMNKEMENKMETAIRKATQLQKEMQDTKNKLMDKKNLDWQDKKALDEMMKKQQELQKMVEDIQKDYKKSLQQQNEFNKMDEQIMEKHKELQKMFDQIMDEKTKKMFEELQKLMEKNNKEGVEKQLDKMKFNDKEVQKELDRMMELFKQLQLEQKMQETADKLDKLAKKQDELANETEKKDNKDSKDNKDPKDGKETKDNKTSDEKQGKEEKQKELEKKQEDLKKEFEDVKKDIKDIEKKNDDLEKKNDLKNEEEDQKDIDQEMQDSKESLEKKQNKKASKSQKNAAKKMDKLGKKMKDMASEMKAKEHEEDYQALRQILENLVYVSFEQENLMNEFKTTTQYNPHYVELAQKQRKLKDDAKLIEDSLEALSKRVTEIKSFVNKEIGAVNFNMDNALQDLGMRNTEQARAHEQYAMTSLNNLALMLSEVMQNMQQQMKQDEEQGKSGKKCSKPKKKGGPSMKKMEELQKQLSDQIKQMKDGKPGGQGGQQMSKQLAEGAARQEAIRRQIQKMEEEMKAKNGNKPGNELGELQKLMDQNEKDLVNKNITEQTIKRQQEIMVRMLESEKAEKKQEMDEERESHTTDNKNNPNPPLLEKYLQMKQKEVEMLHTVPPGLNPYYREKVKTYFRDLKN
jgi:hypothetical protein